MNSIFTVPKVDAGNCFLSREISSIHICRHTNVESDHKPLESILDKPLSATPRRLQGIMIRIQDYDITVRCKKGKEMYIADTQSRVYLTTSQNMQEEFELVNMVSFLPIRDERLQKLKIETDKDDAPQKLKSVIIQGWPDDKQKLPAELTPYYSFRDKMSVQDELSTLVSFSKTRIHIHTSLWDCRATSTTKFAIIQI